MKKTFRKTLALLLTVALMFSLALPAFADGGKNTVNYVAFGDSATNGFGLQDYVSRGCGRDSMCAETYPVRFAQYLESKGNTVNFTNLSLTGMRTNELAFLLDPSLTYEDLDGYGIQRWDEYYRGSPYAGIDVARERYISATKDADIITYGLGVNNFANYMLARTAEIFNISIGFPWGYGGDSFNELMARDNVNISIEFKNAVTKLIETATQGAVTEDMVAGLVEAFLYSYANFVIGFRDSIDLIYQLNPDVELIVFSLDNNLAGMTISFGDIVIDMGLLWAGLLKMANAYIMDLNPHNKQYKYVDISAGIENIMQAVANRGEIYPNLADDILELFYSDNMLGRDGAAQYIGEKAGTAPVSLAQAEQAYRDQNGDAVCIAVNDIIDTFAKAAAFTDPVDFAEGLPLFMDGGLAAFKPLFYEAFADFDSASDLAKSATHLMYYMMDCSAACHPSGYGHGQKYDALVKAYELPVAANGTHLVNLVTGTKALVKDTVKVLTSTNPVQAIRDSLKTTINSLLPIRFGR